MGLHVGEVLIPQNYKSIRMLFGEIYSFDHPEYYYTCARLITYAEYKTDKNYTLEHTWYNFYHRT